MNLLQAEIGKEYIIRSIHTNDEEMETIKGFVKRAEENGVEVKILDREENIELRELCLLNFDRSSAYIALLFLTREEEYELFQEEFYGKLFVKKADKSEVVEEEN